MRHLSLSEQILADLGQGTIAELVAATADIALVLDPDGVVLDLAFGSDALAEELQADWRGQVWVDTVAADSRANAEALLRETVVNGASQWRHILHRTARGRDLPIRYRALRRLKDGRMVLVGRDQQAIEALQEQLMNAQQSLERDYWRLRQVETRYRLLFQMTSDAVLVIDAATLKIIEANPSARHWLSVANQPIVGQLFPLGLDTEGTQITRTLLAEAQTLGRTAAVKVRLEVSQRTCIISANLLRQDQTSLLLVRLCPVTGAEDNPALMQASVQLKALVAAVPDAVVITDMEGRIQSVNAAFLEWAQLVTETQTRGMPLERWLGRPGLDQNVLLANLRQHSSVSLFATTLRGEYGAVTEVELSAAAVGIGHQAGLGFIIRNVGRRVATTAIRSSQQPQSLEPLLERVGRESLKDIVREATDILERQCIDAALDVTRGNRASAAELLGLSRQGLYAKLRRHGITDLTTETENPG